MAGSLSSCDAWFQNPSAQVSSQYGVGLGGELHQYVRLEDTAWANGVLEYGNQWPGPGGVNPNGLSVSIETEDLGNPHQEVTEAMYESVFQACLLALNTYPDIAYLMDHQVISPQSRPSCAGDRWRSGRIQQLANDLELSLILM